MKRKIWQTYLIVMFLAAQVAFAQLTGPIKTQGGLLACYEGDIVTCLNIPYAQPPIGILRWKPPQPMLWGGILGATAFGPRCPQGDPGQLKDLLNRRTGLVSDMSEGCLNLNIWSGAKPGQKLPVLVWIHGGGFGGGSGRIDGVPLARLGIVVVSINYRLGVLGFMAHPDLTRESPHHASGNYGLLDQIAALRWVKDNIAAFGGDPNRVTIGGSSAGGTSIGCLMASPLAKGLFQGAWLDSASRLFLPDPGLSKPLHGLTPMEQVGLQVGPHIRDLRALSTADVMMGAAQVADELYGEGGSGRIGLKPESHVHMPNVHDHPWWAFTDGYVMPDELYTMFTSGRFNHVACLIGTCRDEGLNFTRKMPDLIVDGYKDYLRKYYPAISMKMFAMYPGTTPEEIRAAITRTITDFMFLYGSIRAADFESAAGEPVYVTRFMHVSSGAPGVMHGADAVYFRGDVKVGVTAGQVKYNADDEALSAAMMRRLVAFVKTFDPNVEQASPQWPAWTPKQQQYLEIGEQMQARPFQDQAIINLYRKQLGQWACATHSETLLAIPGETAGYCKHQNHCTSFAGKGGWKMKYRKLGNTGLIVSEVALGTMQFGGKMNMGNLGQEDTTRMVRLALDKGINFIDTADVYSLGESETLLGNALKGFRQEIVLATKVRLPMSNNFNHSGATRVNILREVEDSLRRLQTDYVDLYQVHGWDSNTPLEETLRTLNDLVCQGKVRYIGLSNLMSWQAATAVMLQERLGLEKYVTAQMYYSLVGRGLEHEFQSFAEYHNIGILVWSALAGGFLAGKYTRSNPAPAGTRFAEAGQFVPFDKEMGYRVVDALKEVAARYGASPARVALAWVLGRPAVSSVIVAARKPEHLEDNIRAVDLALADEDVRLLDAASDPGVPYPKWMVLQLDTAEDPRPKVLHPERYAEGGPWKDLRGSKWSG